MLSANRILLHAALFSLLMFSCTPQGNEESKHGSELLKEQLSRQLQQLDVWKPDSINLIRTGLQQQSVHMRYVSDTTVQQVLRSALATLDEFEATKPALMDTLNGLIHRLEILDDDYDAGRLSRKEFEIFRSDEEKYAEQWLLGTEYLTSRVHAQRLLLQTLTDSHKKNDTQQN